MSWEASESSGDGSNPWHGNVAAWIERTFESRQILVRTDAGVRCLQLSTRTQLIAVGVAAALVAWPVVTTLALQVSGAPSVGVVDLQREKRTLEAARRELDRQLARVRRDLALERARHDSTRQDLVSARMAASEAAESADRLERHRAILAQRVADQDQEILAVRKSRLKLADRLSEQARHGASLAQRVAGLELELTSARRGYRVLVKDLSERMRQNIDSIRGIVAGVGLDADALLSEPAPGGGQGGPLLAPEPPTGPLPDQASRTQAAPLYDEVDAWQALVRGVARLPLTPPIDRFRISSRFGTRSDPFTGRRARHLGVDLVAPAGTAVLAPSAGLVRFAGWRKGYGRLVEIAHGNGLVTRYGHLKRTLVKSGQRVERRAPIGTLGSSGRSTGPHLHYELYVKGRAVDPLGFFGAGQALATITGAPVQLADALD